MDRPPKPAPFAVGTRLRYLGSRSLSEYVDYGKPTQREVVLLGPGIEVVVVRTATRGTLRQRRDADGPMFDDFGEAVLDWIGDGYSVYESARVDGRSYGRCIFPESTFEWAVVPDGEEAR